MTWTQIGLTPIFGIPAIAYGGMITLILLLTAATLGYGVSHFKAGGKLYKWHVLTARIAVVFGIMHGFFAMLAMF